MVVKIDGMKREAVRATAEPSLGTLGTAELARELAKQVTQVLGRSVPETPEDGRRVRDPRQDVLWDCASVLQSASRVPATERLLEQLRQLLPLLEQESDADFPERLSAWVAETWDVVRAAR